jgi:nicotinamidase-related amidase
MTVTALDPRTALVLIDLQAGVAGRPALAPVVAKAAELADAFRTRDLPVVLVNVDGRAPGRTERGNAPLELPPGWTDVLPELGDGIRVTKRTWGAFHGTDLDERLREHGVTQIVLGGVATSKGVESTARAAHEHGYHVTVAVDAVGDSDPDAHRNAIERIFPALGETGTADQIVSLLAATPR